MSRFDLSSGLDFRIWHAITETQLQYNVELQVGRKSLDKFGRNENVGTGVVEVNTLNQNETYLTDNLITHVSSSHAGDTEVVVYEGMDLTNDVFSFRTSTVTLQGQTKVALPTPVARLTRAYHTGTTALQGNVFFYQDVAITAGVPNDLSKAHAEILLGEEQTEKACTTIAHSNVFLCLHVWAAMNKKTTASADVDMKVREYGSNFRTQLHWPVSNDTALDREFPVGKIILPGSDIAMTAEGSTTGIDIGAGFSGIFLDIIGDNPFI